MMTSVYSLGASSATCGLRHTHACLLANLKAYRRKTDISRNEHATVDMTRPQAGHMSSSLHCTEDLIPVPSNLIITVSITVQ